MTSVALVLFLKAVSLLCCVLMALKLYRTGLYHRFPVFFAFLIFRIPNSFWPLFLETSSPLYQKVWVLTEPLGRWALYFSLALAVSISAITLLPRIKPSMPQRSRIMFYVLATERGIQTGLAIFIILILCFLSLFPVRLSRNVRVHSLVFSTFFLSGTFVLLMRSLFGMHLADVVNTILLAVTATSLVAWLVLLRTSGEDSVRAPVPIEPEHESRLLAHLDSLNTALLRTSGR
jgi:hypothetical protein